jgi:hypothetical protein
MRKIIICAILALFIFSISGIALAEKTKDRASSGMDHMFYGPVEVPKNLNETNSKGTKVSDVHTEKTRDGVERGIARFTTGLWKLATFWYSDHE